MSGFFAHRQSVQWGWRVPHTWLQLLFAHGLLRLCSAVWSLINYLHCSAAPMLQCYVMHWLGPPTQQLTPTLATALYYNSSRRYHNNSSHCCCSHCHSTACGAMWGASCVAPAGAAVAHCTASLARATRCWTRTRHWAHAAGGSSRQVWLGSATSTSTQQRRARSVSHGR